MKEKRDFSGKGSFPPANFSFKFNGSSADKRVYSRYRIYAAKFEDV